MARLKRYPEMRDTERDQFVADAGRFFDKIQQRMCKLRPTGEQYKRLRNLSGQVNDTVEAVTGEPPRWTQR